MSKVKKKRVGFVLDMTPLVDITFLLLTFFMFTAKFKSESDDNKVVIKRPNTVADTAKLPDKDLVTIKIGIDSVSRDTAYYMSVSNDQAVEKFREGMRAKKYPGEIKDDQKTFKLSDSAWLYTGILEARAANFGVPKLMYAIDADRSLRFFWINQLMKTMSKARATEFYFVTEKKQG